MFFNMQREKAEFPTTPAKDGVVILRFVIAVEEAEITF